MIRAPIAPTILAREDGRFQVSDGRGIVVYCGFSQEAAECVYKSLAHDAPDLSADRDLALAHAIGRC